MSVGSNDEVCQPTPPLVATGAIFANVFEKLPAPMLLCTVEGEILDVNRAMGELFGVEASTLVGVRLAEIRSLETRTAMSDALAELRECNQVSREIRFLRDDTFFWGQVRIMRVDDSGQTSFVVLNIEDLSELRRVEEELATAARIDPLTGLANRTAIMERLDDVLATADERPAMALFCDLDGLKELNDSRGHHVGDELLRRVGERLLGASLPDDTVGRMSGDEFVVIGSRATQADAEDQASSLLAAFRQPFNIAGRSEKVTISVGVAVGNRDVSGARMLRAADEAMYRAKRSGAGHWRLATI